MSQANFQSRVGSQNQACTLVSAEAVTMTGLFGQNSENARNTKLIAASHLGEAAEQLDEDGCLLLL